MPCKLLYVIQVKRFLIKCSISWPYLISEFLVAYICGLALFLQPGCFCLALVKPQNLRVYVIYNPQALSSTLALLGHHSPGPSGYKFRRPLRFNLYLLHILVGLNTFNTFEHPIAFHQYQNIMITIWLKPLLALHDFAVLLMT